MSVDRSGAGVAAGLFWDAVHDRVVLSTAPAGTRELKEYWKQLHNLVHELQHIFGGGYGEYYGLKKLMTRLAQHQLLL